MNGFFLIGVSTIIKNPVAPANPPVPLTTGCAQVPSSTLSPSLLTFAQYLKVKSIVPDGSPVHEPSWPTSMHPLNDSVPVALNTAFFVCTSLNDVIAQEPTSPPAILEVPFFALATVCFPET